jgi:hypothetical protein
LIPSGAVHARGSPSLLSFRGRQIDTSLLLDPCLRFDPLMGRQQNGLKSPFNCNFNFKSSSSTNSGKVSSSISSSGVSGESVILLSATSTYGLVQSDPRHQTILELKGPTCLVSFEISLVGATVENLTAQRECS